MTIMRLRQAGSMAAAGVLLAGANLCAAKEPRAAKPAAKPAAPAAAAPAADLTVSRKVVEGMLVHAGKRSISVETEVVGDVATDMLLPLAETVEVRGAKSVADLKRGDRVKVGIEQSFRAGDDGQPVLVKTEALVIVVLPPAPAAAEDGS